MFSDTGTGGGGEKVKGETRKMWREAVTASDRNADGLGRSVAISCIFSLSEVISAAYCVSSPLPIKNTKETIFVW